MALFLKEADVRQLLTMGEAIQALEDAFLSLARGDATNYPRQRAAHSGIAVNLLVGISAPLDAAGVKCYPIVRRDVTVGSSFTLLLYRISTGGLAGIIEANALGQIRTGAASGVAMKHLARPDSRIMTLFGAGWQAESQVEAAAQVLPELTQVNVIGRSPERTRKFCREMEARLNCRFVARENGETAVKEADVITTVTGSSEPLFDGRWLRKGVHINAVGSNYAEKRELDATAIRHADRIVVDDIAVAQKECGDLLADEVRVVVDWGVIRSLAEVVSGAAAGRTSPDESTLFESHGMGIEDLAVGALALAKAERQGLGVPVPLS